MDAHHFCLKISLKVLGKVSSVTLILIIIGICYLVRFSLIYYIFIKFSLGSIDSLYNGNYADQPQVWRLNESIVDKCDPTSLSTLQEVCGINQDISNDESFNLKLDDNALDYNNNDENDNEFVKQPSSDILDDNKHIELDGMVN